MDHLIYFAQMYSSMDYYLAIKLNDTARRELLDTCTEKYMDDFSVVNVTLLYRTLADIDPARLFDLSLWKFKPSPLMYNINGKWSYDL